MSKKNPSTGKEKDNQKDENSFWDDDEFSSVFLSSFLSSLANKNEIDKGKVQSNLPYKVVVELKITGNEDGILTPYSLEYGLSPYLRGINEIQNAINELLNLKSRLIRIEKITQNSPISVSLDGVAEALAAIQEMAVPWRRKHYEKMALLNERQKMAEIESLKAETLEKHALAEKNRAEAIRYSAEATKQRSEAERIHLENEKLRLELRRAKIQLVLDFLNHLAPKLSEQEKISYMMKLMSSFEAIIESELEISKIQEINS